jgi:hypothetical protein
MKSVEKKTTRGELVVVRVLSKSSHTTDAEKIPKSHAGKTFKSIELTEEHLPKPVQESPDPSTPLAKKKKRTRSRPTFAAERYGGRGNGSQKLPLRQLMELRRRPNDHTAVSQA